MQTSYLSWDDAVEVFRRRGLPESAYGSLYEEEYLLVPGPLTVSGAFPLNDHDALPFGGDAPTGYIVDGDLTIDGNLFDEDDGAAALVVLGRLRVRDVWLTCDPKLIVLGDVEVGSFGGTMTDKLVVLHGDLRAKVLCFDAEFFPDAVAGTVAGRLVVPRSVDLARLPVGGLADPAGGTPLKALVVDEVLEGADGIDRDAWADRVAAGLPVTR